VGKIAKVIFILQQSVQVLDGLYVV